MNQSDKYKVLLVDDDPQVLKMLAILYQEDYEIFLASSGLESIDAVRRNGDIAAVVMDIKMAGMGGIAAAREIKKIEPGIPIIFHTGYPGEYDEEEIDEQEKPFEYVEKGESISKLTRAIRNAVESHVLKSDAELLSARAETTYEMIGCSPQMLRVYNLIRKVAATDIKVIVVGETGTGKYMVAKAIHDNGKRKSMHFYCFACSHKSPELIESELFGHVKGAFTGALDDKIGVFEYANGGTVLLDEVGDLDLNTQSKLLQVLENGEYRTIGDPRLKKTNIRIICATQRNLEQMVKSGDYRGDFYFRINGITIPLPPLRERGEDIRILIEKFKDQFTIEQGKTPIIFDPLAIDLMVAFGWPGNVRQLQDTVESLIILSESDIIFEDDVRNYLNILATEGDKLTAANRNLTARLREFRRQCIIEALKETKGKVRAAAALLGVDPANLRKMIKQLKIESGGSKNSG